MPNYIKPKQMTVPIMNHDIINSSIQYYIQYGIKILIRTR